MCAYIFCFERYRYSFMWLLGLWRQGGAWRRRLGTGCFWEGATLLCGCFHRDGKVGSGTVPVPLGDGVGGGWCYAFVRRGWCLALVRLLL